MKQSKEYGAKKFHNLTGEDASRQCRQLELVNDDSGIWTDVLHQRMGLLLCYC